MSIVGKVKNFINNAKADSLELEMYRKEAALASPKNQWYRLLNPNGDHVGFSWLCSCGVEYQMVAITDWFGREYNCTACSRPLSLFKACGITQQSTPATCLEKFAQLPVRGRRTGKPDSPKFLDTWSGETNDSGSGPAGAVPAGEVQYVPLSGGFDDVAFGKKLW
jgi:hypothetical protein